MPAADPGRVVAPTVDGGRVLNPRGRGADSATRAITALTITVIALVGGGMVVGQLTGRPSLRSGSRQPLLGAVAVAVTYGVGLLIGSAPG